MKNKMKEFFAKLPQSIMLIFGIMIVVFTTVAFVNGFEALSVYRVYQLLGIAVVAGALMLVAFSDIFIKKINQIFRSIIFIFPTLITTLVFALAFSWFPAGNIKSWAIFSSSILSRNLSEEKNTLKSLRNIRTKNTINTHKKALTVLNKL